MHWIGILLLVIHVAVCTGLILIVLLQAGKGASLGAAFGGGASQTVFGARSATFIGRLTWVLFSVFMITSLLLTMSPWREEGAAPSGILQEETVPQSSEATPQQFAPDGALSGEVTQPAETAPAEGAPGQGGAIDQPGDAQSAAPAGGSQPESPDASEAHN